MTAAVASARGGRVEDLGKGIVAIGVQRLLDEACWSSRGVALATLGVQHTKWRASRDLGVGGGGVSGRKWWRFCSWVLLRVKRNVQYIALVKGSVWLYSTRRRDFSGALRWVYARMCTGRRPGILMCGVPSNVEVDR